VRLAHAPPPHNLQYAVEERHEAHAQLHDVEEQEGQFHIKQIINFSAAAIRVDLEAYTNTICNDHQTNDRFKPLAVYDDTDVVLTMQVYVEAYLAIHVGMGLQQILQAGPGHRSLLVSDQVPGHHRLARVIRDKLHQ